MVRLIIAKSNSSSPNSFNRWFNMASLDDGRFVAWSGTKRSRGTCCWWHVIEDQDNNLLVDSESTRGSKEKSTSNSITANIQRQHHERNSILSERDFRMASLCFVLCLVRRLRHVEYHSKQERSRNDVLLNTTKRAKNDSRAGWSAVGLYFFYFFFIFFLFFDTWCLLLLNVRDCWQRRTTHWK